MTTAIAKEVRWTTKQIIFSVSLAIIAVAFFVSVLYGGSIAPIAWWNNNPITASAQFMAIAMTLFMVIGFTQMAFTKKTLAVWKYVVFVVFFFVTVAVGLVLGTSNYYYGRIIYYCSSEVRSVTLTVLMFSLVSLAVTRMKPKSWPIIIFAFMMLLTIIQGSPLMDVLPGSAQIAALASWLVGYPYSASIGYELGTYIATAAFIIYVIAGRQRIG